MTPDESGRVSSVDFLRGIAMMGLVLVHSVLYFTPLNEDVDLVYVVFSYVLGDLGAAAFTTLVGISFVLSMRSRTGLRSSTVIVGATVRGLFLLAVAMLVSVITTGPETVFEWDVLALIAVASIVVAFLRPLPTWALLLVAAGIVAAAPFVRGAVGYLQWWGGALNPVDGLVPVGILVHPAADFAPGLDPVVAGVGLLAAGWFPLLPWLAFPVIGMAMGRQITLDRVRVGTRWLVLGAVSVAGGVVLAFSAVTRGGSDPVTEHWSVLSFTPNSTSLFLVQLGLVLLLLGTTHVAMDGRRPPGAWMDPIRLVSRYALTVYVLSYAVIFGAIHLADLVDPGAPHQYGMTTSGWALAFGVTLLAVLVPVLRVWDAHGGTGSLEWMLAHLRLRAKGAA